MLNDEVTYLAEELDVLVGATVTRVWVEEPDPEYAWEQPHVNIAVRFKKGLTVNGDTTGVYGIWQDPEGNGPGFLAFLGKDTES